MEDRLQKGPRFNCDEKFGRGHNKVCQRIFLLDLAEAAEDEDDVQQAHDTEDPLISLLAITGVRTSETMQVRILVGARRCWPCWTRGRPITSSRPKQPVVPPYSCVRAGA
jgi:hypothetical protein